MVNIVSLLFNSASVLLFYSLTQLILKDSRLEVVASITPLGLSATLGWRLALYYCPKEAALALIALQLHTAGHRSVLHKAAASSTTSVYTVTTVV
jgi:hypothetical protein